MSRNGSDDKPSNTAEGTDSKADIDLPRAVVVEMTMKKTVRFNDSFSCFLQRYIHPTLRNRNSAHHSRQRERNSLPHRRRHMRLARILLPRIMSNDHPKAQINREKRHKLRMATGHAVTLSQHLRRPRLANVPLEHPVERFAGHLAGEHEQDFHLARGVEEGGVGDAEGLRDEGEEGAGVGEAGGGVVVDVGEGEGGQGWSFHFGGGGGRVDGGGGGVRCLGAGVPAVSRFGIWS